MIERGVDPRGVSGSGYLWSNLRRKRRELRRSRAGRDGGIVAVMRKECDLVSEGVAGIDQNERGPTQHRVIRHRATGAGAGFTTAIAEARNKLSEPPNQCFRAFFTPFLVFIPELSDYD